jgi:hypothetical protein
MGQPKDLREIRGELGAEDDPFFRLVEGEPVFSLFPEFLHGKNHMREQQQIQRVPPLFPALLVLSWSFFFFGGLTLRHAKRRA